MIGLLQNFAEGDERLNVSSRADNMYDDIQGWWGLLTSRTTEGGWDIAWRMSGRLILMGKVELAS